MKRIFRGILFLFLLGLVFINHAHGQCQYLNNIQFQEQADGLLISGFGNQRCEEIEINVYCDKRDGALGYMISPVSGPWQQLVYYDDLKGVKCCTEPEQDISVGISCRADDQIVCAITQVVRSDCQADDPCPRVNIDADSPVCGNRGNDGTWPVAFEISSQPGRFTGTYHILFGDGTSTNLTSAQLDQDSRIVHSYICPRSAPPYEVTIVANGCQTDPLHSSLDTMTIDFPGCDCPVVEDIAHEVQGCAASFGTAIPACQESVTQYIWNFGDNTTLTTDSLTSPEHVYNQNGTYTVTLTLAGAGDNCTSSTTVDITQCPQGPECGNGIIEYPETCDGNCPTSCDDNNPCTRDELLGSAQECNARCRFSRILDCISGDGCCPPGCTRQNDRDCGNGNDDTSICGIFDWCCWLVALFMGLYILFWVMWNYNVLPTAWVIGALALAALVAWILICEPSFCGVLLVLFAAGIVALAIMGVIALVPGSPMPPVVIPSVQASYPAALLSVITLILLPLLFLVGDCVADCTDFSSCLQALWDRASRGR